MEENNQKKVEPEIKENDQKNPEGADFAKKTAGVASRKVSDIAGEGTKKVSKMAGKAVEKAGRPIGKAIGGAMGIVGGPQGAKVGSEIGGTIGNVAGKVAGKGIEKGGKKAGEGIEKVGEKVAEAEGVAPRDKKRRTGGGGIGGMPTGKMVQGIGAGKTTGGMPTGKLAQTIGGGGLLGATAGIATKIGKSIINKAEGEQSDKSFSLTSPEAIMMLFIAVILDLIGYVLLVAALDDFWLTDIVGVLIIGSWIFTRSGGKRTAKGNPKMKGLKRFGLATVVEAIPYVGSLSPSWSIMVYKELKNNP